MNRKILISMFLIYSHSSILFAQVASKDQEISSEPQLGNKHSLYLIRENSDETESILFRLYNNTPWAIRIRRDWQYAEPISVEVILLDGRREFGLADNAEFKPEYFIESPLIKGGLTGQYGCTFDDAWVGARQSVYFRVPRAAFPKLAILYVFFRYEWEDDQSNTQHRVQFRWNELNRAQ
jgi:hypothetical protein